MICLNDTDVIEAWSDTAAVIDYHIFGLVGTAWTRLASGVLGNIANVVIFTAGAATSIVSMTFTNIGGAAATVNLKLDPANGGNDKFLLTKAVSLEAGYGLVFDGQRFYVMDPTGAIVTSYAVHASTHASGGSDPFNIVNDTSPQAGGEFDFQANSAGFTLQTATGDGTTTIDWRLGNKFKFTHGAMAETFTFTAPSNPCNLMMIIVQDGVGGRDSTWPGTVTFLGTEPTWTDGGAGKAIAVSFFWDGTTYWAIGSAWEE